MEDGDAAMGRDVLSFNSLFEMPGVSPAGLVPRTPPRAFQFSI